MDKINSILSSIKERLSNPLIFSFICSWLIINWKITVALVWYDAAQIKNEGFKSVFEFIGDKLNFNNAFLHPILFALAYTFLMPLIRNVILAFNSWSGKWGNNWNLKILKGGQISIDRYMLLRQNYEDRTKILEEVISKEKTNIIELESAKTELLKAQVEINKLTNLNHDYQDFKRDLLDNKRLEGYWTVTYKDTADTKLQGKEEIYIQGDKYYILKQFDQKEYAFDIINYCYNRDTKVMLFIKEKRMESRPISDGNSKHNINVLRFVKEGLFVGTENGSINIEYKRTIIPIHEDVPIIITGNEKLVV